ncbi:type IV pilus modification protein PilV [Pseudorhodoferax sp.]|uniref:type IV pilus modification protein PilV n=1 Tax=Pseudorhodoferax sp. TaxID=1993553 RepID=UPI0039E4EFC0
MCLSGGRGRQQGFTLLESLIAIVLVALGVLGILGVQLRTLSDTQTAVRRAQALRLIEDLSERIKTNPSALTEAVLDQYVVDWGAVAGAVPDCSAGCTAANLARHDVLRWKDTVQATMPLGDARVFRAADAGSANSRPMLGVMISWRENEREGATAAQTAQYKAPFAMPPASAASGAGGGSVAVACPAERICHLQYLVPTLRCTADALGGGTDPLVYCP